MTGAKRVLKWPVPVDDKDHPIGAGKVVLVGCQNGDPSTVQVWTEEDAETRPDVSRRARVYGTGQAVPAGDEHIGSVIAPTPPSSTLVWHVYGSPQ